jgi:hypothetical protein
VSGDLLQFDSEHFGPVFRPLLAVERIPELGPGRPEETHRNALHDAVRRGFDHSSVKHQAAAKAFMAGMWLLFDFLDESHEISQSLPDEWGAYWHGIMHRREPDAWNSKYWFRRVRTNPIAASLKIKAQEFGYDYRDPLVFVDDCERQRGKGDEHERRLRLVQLAEIRLLLKHHFDAATQS